MANEIGKIQYNNNSNNYNKSRSRNYVTSK